MFRVNLLKGFLYPLTSLPRLLIAWLVLPLSLAVLVPPILAGLTFMGVARVTLVQGLAVSFLVGCVCVIVGAIPFTFLAGYLLRCRKHVIEGMEKLPPWNKLGDLLADGGRMDTLGLIIGVPTFTLVGTGILMVGATLTNVYQNHTWGAVLLALIGSGAGIMFLLLALGVYLLVLFFAPIATLRLARGHSPLQALQLGGMLRDIRCGFLDYIVMAVVVWTPSVLFSIAQASCPPLVIVSFPVQVYLQLVWANLLGQYARAYLKS